MPPRSGSRSGILIMINLIPNQEKKAKVRDFYFRLVVIVLAVVGSCVLVASAATLPAYFLSSVKRNIANEKLILQKSEPVPLIDQDSLRAIFELNNKLNLIEKAKKNKYNISEKVINEVMLKKMSDIKINQITYENDPTSGKKISVYGTAPSRERLLFFRRALEEDTAFQKVDLPISNFVKGSNIEFYISLIPLQ